MIRSYTTDDQEQILGLFHLNTPTYFAPEEEQDLLDYLTKDSKNYFVIEQQGSIIGAGGFNWFEKKQTARISWDLVHPEQQDKGIGKTITAFRIKKIKAESPSCKIIVRTSQHVFQFYEKQGFSLTTIEKDYWADGFDLYLMTFKQ